MGRVELTTVTTDSATFHRGTGVTVVDGLQPATAYRRFGIAYSTLPQPAGRLRCRLATVNDVHFGETEAGRVGERARSDPAQVAAGATPYPVVMNRAAAAELGAADDAAPFAAVIAKGDLRVGRRPGGVRRVRGLLRRVERGSTPSRQTRLP